MKFFKKTAICLICIVTVAFCATGVTATGSDGTADGYIRYEEARAVSSDEVYLGGIPFGIRLYSGELRVIGFTKIDSENGDESPAYDAGIRENDVIISVNGKAVRTASELIDACESCGGKEITLECIRGKETMTFSFKPSLSESENKYKTGMWIKDSTAGIGTMTYIVPDTCAFAGLGHCIYNNRTGELENAENGTVMDVEITGVDKGSEGDPGELSGKFMQKKIGTLAANTEEGVFGLLTEIPELIGKDDLVTVKSCGKEGDAEIRCTLTDNKPQLYSIKITSVKPDEETNKNYVIEVTDDKLIEETGGIVQGMSGSPIIQDGKLIGAVTHVFVNDPKKGFGISMENMEKGMPEILT